MTSSWLGEANGQIISGKISDSLSADERKRREREQKIEGAMRLMRPALQYSLFCVSVSATWYVETGSLHGLHVIGYLDKSCDAVSYTLRNLAEQSLSNSIGTQLILARARWSDSGFSWM